MKTLNAAILITLMLAMSLGASAATMLWYDFEQGTPETVMNPGTEAAVGATDISGNGYDMWGWASATQNNSPSFSALGDTPVGYGLSARFPSSGKDGYTNNATDLNAWSPLAWTIEVSAKLDSLTQSNGWQTIIGRSGSSLSNQEADFYLQKNGGTDQWRLNFRTTANENIIIDSNSVVVEAGQWYHIALTSDGTTVTMYVDDFDGNGYEVEGTATFAAPGSNTNALAQGGFLWTFGRGWFNGSNSDFIIGNIDDVRFTDVTLTPDQFLHSAYDLSSPVPAHESTNISLTPTLTWQFVNANVTADSFKVYGPTTDPNLVDPNQPRTPDYTPTSQSQAITGLVNEKLYYWRVDTVVGTNTYTGPIWQFTTVPQAPTILTQPADWLVVDLSSTGTFTVVAANADTYKWYKQGDPTVLSETDTLTINGTVANEGRYYCEVSNSVNPGVVVTSSADRGRFLTKRLVGVWKMENNMLDSVKDVYPDAIAHDGVFVPGTGGVEAYAAGDPNNGAGMVFANTAGGTRVAVDAANENFFDFYTKGLTASIWVKTTTDAWRLPFAKLQAGVTGWLIGMNTGNSRTAQFIFEARGGIATSSAVNVRDGNWHMITVMYDADAKQRRTYVDG
ncbi:MAG: hypothetical protein LLF76_15630, partial [Planctomycetaceae bacterium]|nr:hypothetical protein [Planctomycetaceae bacterium]